MPLKYGMRIRFASCNCTSVVIPLAFLTFHRHFFFSMCDALSALVGSKINAAAFHDVTVLSANAALLCYRLQPWRLPSRHRKCSDRTSTTPPRCAIGSIRLLFFFFVFKLISILVLIFIAIQIAVTAVLSLSES